MHVEVSGGVTWQEWVSPGDGESVQNREINLERDSCVVVRAVIWIDHFRYCHITTLSNDSKEVVLKNTSHFKLAS